MPSLGTYCQGMIRYIIACQASVDTAIILYKKRDSDYGDSPRMTLFNGYVEFYADWVPATCAINNATCAILRNQLPAQSNNAGLETRLQIQATTETDRVASSASRRRGRRVL